MRLSIRIYFAIFAAMVPCALLAAEGQNVVPESEITLEGVGTLSTKRIGVDGFVAQFRASKPASLSCSGSCGDRGSVSWTCDDGQSCLLRCDTDPPSGECTADQF